MAGPAFIRQVTIRNMYENALRQIDQSVSIGEPARIASGVLAEVKAFEAAAYEPLTPEEEAAIDAEAEEDQRRYDTQPALLAALKELTDACGCIRPFAADVSFENIKDGKLAIRLMNAVDAAKTAIAKAETASDSRPDGGPA